MNSPDNPLSILVYDSGVGGLSLLPALERAVPGAELVFASDNAAYPYGTRHAAVVTARTVAVLAALATDLHPDLVIVACNTASTVALPTVRARLNCPVVGVVPAIKPAAASTRTGCIALLATPATVARPYTAELIRDFAAGCSVLSFGSSELVDLAERRLRGERIDHATLLDLLTPLRTDPRYRDVDVVVLGCTHFPLLRDELAAALPEPRDWLDSGEAVARRAHTLLAGEPRSALRGGRKRALFTREGADLDALRPALAARGFATVEVAAQPFDPVTPAAVRLGAS